MSELEQCAGLDTAAMKLACFEAIAAGSREIEEVAPAVAPEPAPETVAVPAADTARVSGPEPGPLADASPESGLEQAASTSAAQSPAIQAPTAASAPTFSAADAAPPATGDDSFGREYLESVEESRSKIMSAAVVDVTTTRYGEFVFHLDNGQVWAQLEKRYFPYPRNQPFDVKISVGLLGEYKLQVGGTGRKVTVKRVK